MTPRPRRFLFLSLLCATLFGVLAVLVAAQIVIIRFDAQVTSACFHFANDRPFIRNLFVIITDLGAGRPLYYVGTLAVCILVLRREWLRSLVWTIGLLASRPISPWLKGQFERPRPPFVDWPDFSFPSGHAYGSAVVYGMLALVVLRALHRYRWKWVVAGMLWMFIALVALSRLMLGVHYPSDVIAGTSIGLAWGFYWAAAVDWWELPRMRGGAQRIKETKDPD